MSIKRRQLSSPCGGHAQILVIVAASYLDAVTFQICSQAFKIVPTAVFAAVLLGQRLSPLQWASLPVLAAGITLITSTGGSPKSPPPPPPPSSLSLVASLLWSVLPWEVASDFCVSRDFLSICGL